MDVRILLSRAGQSDRRIIAKAVVSGFETGMLAGEDQRRSDADAAKRSGDRGELDGFGTRADDDNNWAGQPSP